LIVSFLLRNNQIISNRFEHRPTFGAKEVEYRGI
jgi:hypothetical protein